VDYVLDASAAVDALISTAKTDAVHAIIEEATLVAPSFIDVEVLSALARLERAETINQVTARQAISNWGDIPLTRVDTDSLLETVWTMRASIRISDAFYLSLAKQYRIPLLTSDGRLARAPHPGIVVTHI
jgi:predicted nucleic acid-binding protein